VTPSIVPREVADSPERTLEPARDAERCAPLAPAFLWSGAAFALVFGGLATSSVWVALITAGPLVLLALLGPSWARRSMARFDRDFVSLVARGASDRLRRRFALALGMRCFAERHLVDERRGRVALACCDPRTARRAYARALAVWRDDELAPLSVRLGYADACYQLEDDSEAIWTYRRIAVRHDEVPRVAVNLVHALLRSGAEHTEVGDALARAHADTDEERLVLELVRGRMAAESGNARRARLALARSGPGSTRVEELRRELWRALGGAAGERVEPARVIALRPRRV
jgi:hypothetical protein